MKLGKFYILSLWGLICSGILFSSRSAVADDPSKIVQMPIEKFWEGVSGEKLKGNDGEFIICGDKACKVGVQNCIVKTTERKQHFNQITDGLDYILGGFITGSGLIKKIRGSGSVLLYEYKCINQNEKLPEGYTVAPEGGFVFKRTVRTGGWINDTNEIKGRCSSGTDGGLYCLATHNHNLTANYNAADTAFRGCEVLPVKLYNNRKCFFCPLFTVVYKVAGEMTAISFGALGAAFALLLAMGLAIWIAVQTLTQVSSLTKQDAPKFLSGLIKQSYKVLIAFLLLQYSSQIFEYGITPVLEAGLEFGSAMLEEKYTVMKTNDDVTGVKKLEELNPGITERLSTLSNTSYYTSNLYLALDNFVVNLQRNIAFMQSVGSSLICIGSNALMFKGEKADFGSGFQMVIQGVLLAGFGFLLSIAFAFYLVDAVVQMGIAGALMPFLIASWPFKLTAKYANTGWSMILNSAFVFVFAGLVLSVNLNLISAALDMTAGGEQTDTIENKQCDNPEDCAAAEINMGGLYKIAQAINTQNEPELVKLTDISTVGFLILLFCCIFGFKFLGRAGQLAGKFAGGALKPIAPSIATMGGSAAKSLALKTTQSTREAIGDKVNAAGRAVASVPGRLWGAATGRGRYGKGKNAGGDGGSGSNDAANDAAEEDDELPETETDGEEEETPVMNEGAPRAQAVRNQRTASPSGRRTPRFSETAGGVTPVTARMNERGTQAETKSGGAVPKESEKASAQDGDAANVERAKRSGRRKGSDDTPKNGSRQGRRRGYFRYR